MDAASYALAKKYTDTKTVSKIDAVNANHFFVDDAARDAYFVTNPTEKVVGVLISSNDVYQIWNGSAWIVKTVVPLASKSGKFTLVVAASDATVTEKAQADYVCTGNGDQAQIQAAINALPVGGGTVQLTSGTFNISRLGTTNVGIYIDKDNVTVKGMGMTTILKRDTDVNPFTVIAFGASALGLRQAGVNYGTIMDLQVDGSDATKHVDNKGVFFMGAITGADVMSHSTVINVVAHNCGYEGISLDYQIKTLLQNNYCYDNLEAGIALYGASQSVVDGNICINNNPRAMNLTGVSNSKITNNYLDNGVQDVSGYAIAFTPLKTGENVYNGSSNIVSGNIIKTKNGIAVKTSVNGNGDSNVIVGNKIECSGNHIAIESDYNTVNGNTLTGVGHGLLITSGHFNILNGNTMHDLSTGVTVADTYNTVAGNTIDTPSLDAVIIAATGDYTIISDNILTAGADKAIMCSGAGCKINGNHIKGFTADYSIYVSGANVEVSCNYLDAGRGIKVAGTYSNVSGNIFNGILTTPAIDIYNVNYVNISNNYIYGGASYGIGIDLVLNSNIACNYIYGATIGIRVAGAANYNNIIGNFVQGCSSIGLHIRNTATGNIAKNNALISNTGGNLLDEGITSVVLNNHGYVSEKSGTASIADGGTIAHGLAKTPTSVSVVGATSGDILSITSVDATNITVAIKKQVDGTGDAVAQNVYWRASFSGY